MPTLKTNTPPATTPAKPPRGVRWLTLTEAAVEVDLSVRQLQDYARRPGCPRKADGKGGWRYEWPAFNRFVREALAEDARESARPGDYDAAKTRKMEADARLSELQLAREQAEVVQAAKFETALARAFGRVRSRLLSLPTRVAPEMLGLTDELVAERLLDRYILEVLEELRTEPVPDDEDELEAEPEPEPTAPVAARPAKKPRRRKAA